MILKQRSTNEHCSSLYAASIGHCTSIGECAAACPAGIQLEVISRMNKDFIRATLLQPEQEPLATIPRPSPMRAYLAEKPP